VSISSQLSISSQFILLIFFPTWIVVNDINFGSAKVFQWVPRRQKVLTHGQERLFRKVTSVSIHSFVEWLDTFSYVLRPTQASTLTFVRLSGTSENWHRTSRSCITVVRRDKWRNQIPKRAGTTDKSISTGIKYWVCCIKEPCLTSNLSIIYFD
jgi:hypothetical protein